MRRVGSLLGIGVLLALLALPGCFRERFRVDGFAVSEDANAGDLLAADSGDQLVPPDSTPIDVTVADALDGSEDDAAPGDGTDDVALDGVDGLSPDGIGDLSSDGADDGSADSSDDDSLDGAEVDTLPIASFGGNVGTPPDTPFVSLGALNIVGNATVSRIEVISTSIPLAKADNVTDPSRLAILDSSGKGLRPAYFRVLSRWRGDDATPWEQRPIRWLQITDYEGVFEGNPTPPLQLRYYDQPPVYGQKYYDLKVSQEGETLVVDTGLAIFRVNPRNPALLEEVTAFRYPLAIPALVYQHRKGAGPRLRFAGTVLETLAQYDATTSTPTSGVVVDPSPSDPKAPDFEIVEQNAQRIILKSRGHFVHPAARVDCTMNGVDDPIDRFGYTAVLTIFAGFPSIELELELRNECSGETGDFTAGHVTIDGFDWVVPLVFSPTTVYGALDASQANTQLLGENTTEFELLQQKGLDSGTGWTRRAILRQLGAPKPLVQTSDEARLPYLAVTGEGFSATIQSPLLRYREPQGLAVRIDRFEYGVVSDTLTLGAGKGIRGRVLLGYLAIPGAGNVEKDLKFLVSIWYDRLELPLLLRRPLSLFNQTGAFPYLGDETTQTPLKQQYRTMFEQLDQVSFGDGDEPPPFWLKSKSFGLQLWPDLVFDSTALVTSPDQSPLTGDRGSLVLTHLLEYLRGGDPAYVFNIALPLSELLLSSAWINTGKQPSRYNGFYVGDGTGEGDWHRPTVGPTLGQTHNLGIQLAYALRPSPIVLDRFRQAADAFRLRYDKPITQQGERGPDQRIELASLDGSRGGESLFQHLEMLQNCAEFVPGKAGDDCLSLLDAVYDELVIENIVAKTACAGDPAPTTSCLARSYELLGRSGALTIFRYITALRPDTATSNALRAMLVESGRQLVEKLLPTLQPKNVLDTSVDWPLVMQCTRNGDALDSCAPSNAPVDQADKAWRPSLLALVFIAAELDPSFDPCPLLINTYNDLNLYAGWLSLVATGASWDARTSAMLQSAIFAVGGLDRCMATK